MVKGKADRGPGITARLWDSSLIRNSASESLQIGQRSEMKGSITMKKLMIAASAALCATVGFGELASANVVGYQDKGVRVGYTMTGPSFVSVGATEAKIDLTEIKVAGYEGENMEVVVIQTLDYLGNAVDTYSWMDDDGAGDFDPGWYNGDYEAIEPGTVFIDAGTALWTAGDDGLSLTYAGQVWTARSSIPLRVGYTAVANPSAGAVDLTDVVVEGYEGENMEVVVIQTLDYLGNAIDSYSWMDDDGAGDFDPGWYNGDYEAIEEGTVFIQPGEGLWVAGDAGLTLEFPATSVQ